jgi:4-O-beta-D-mannosyl-D-glucose phosphorylase
MKNYFSERQKEITRHYEDTIEKKNKKTGLNKSGVYDRYTNPVLTSGHIPLTWRYDLNEKTNPYLLERIGANAVLNPGAIKWKNKYLLMVRVE